MPKLKRPNLRCTMDWGIKGDTLCIIDLDIGGCSVTNDADAVVEWAWEQASSGRIPKYKNIIYSDSDGIWDELKFNEGKFLGFKGWRKKTSDEVIAGIKEKTLKVVEKNHD